MFKAIQNHITRCIFAGVVTLLPIGGTILFLVYLESQLRPLVKGLPIHFPGMALVLVVVGFYVLGLVVSSFFGRWLFNLIDRLLDSLPGLGALYQSLKQILGYGKGEHAIFERVVAIPDAVSGGRRLGLVTGEAREAEWGQPGLVVFLPTAPNPTNGTLVVFPESDCHHLDMEVDDAFKFLLSAGKYSGEE